MELLLTLITGLCFFIGYVFGLFSKDKNKVGVLAISLAFVVLVNLICFDILPEVIENFSWISVLFILVGLFLLKLLDLFVPHHHHHHEEINDDIKEHEDHIDHVNIITVIALFLHNILEAMALYGVSTTNLKSGFLMALGVAMHNIPLGLSFSTNKNKKNIIYLILLSLSGLFGGIICMFIGSLSPTIEHYILCLTLGMLLYLTIFEFCKDLWSNRRNINTLYGIIIGIVFVVITFII